MDISCLSGIHARRKDTDMFCPNCGKGNPDGVAFCSGCGMAFGSLGSQPAPQPAASQPVPAPAPAPQPAVPPIPEPVVPPIPEPVVSASPAYTPVHEPVAAAPIAPQPQVEPRRTYEAPQPKPGPDPEPNSSSVSFGQHFKNLFNAAIHPVTGPAEIANQYNRIGDALFLAGIVVVVLWLISFTSSMTIDLIHHDYYNNLGKVIWQDCYRPMINYSIRIFGCAGIFMLAGLILREKWSFARLLAISAMAAAPAYLVSEFMGSFLGLIPYIRFGTLISIAAYAYYLLMLFEGMGAETKLTGNKKGFVLVICLAITGYAVNILTI